MIDPDDPLEIQVEKQARIIDALIRRNERRHEFGESAYSLFQSAISLQTEVWRKTRDLQAAQETLGQTARDLQAAQMAHETLQKTLADAMIAMEGGFALFSESRLQVWNTLFQQLLPDVEPLVAPGLSLDDWHAAVGRSRFVNPDPSGEVGLLAARRPAADGASYTSSILALKNDRWFQISQHRTSSDNVVLQQTEITDIVRENRRQKEMLIDQHGEFLQAAFDHMPIGICTFSARGDLLVRNDHFGELLGVPLRLLRPGTAFRRILGYLERFDLLDRDRGAPPGEGWLKTMLRGHPAQGQLRRSDGMCLDMRVRPLPAGGFVVTLLDITAEADAAVALERRVEERTAELSEANRQLELHMREQARAEEALREAKEAAEAANRSKTRFIAAASHDLLQPINAAKLYISSLRDAELPEEAGQTVERLDRSFASIESLLSAILDISRLDSPGIDFRVSDFCIGTLLDGIAADFSHLADERGIQLRVVPCARWVRSDRRYLSRSLQNLVVNAIQYTKWGRVVVGCRRRGNRLRVEVHDTGIGIPTADQARIFNEFTRIGETGAGGMGLGLSIVERACRHLGHPLGLVSEPGRGSIFSIELPLADPARGASERTAPCPDEQEDAQGLIVMIVENDADVLHATSAKLESWGAGVVAVSSTAEALGMMEDLGTAPDIVLADYQLDDGATGIETIRALRARAGHAVPAVLITANRSRALLREAEAMALPVLSKPVQLARLRSLIDWQTRRAEDMATPTKV